MYRFQVKIISKAVKQIVCVLKATQRMQELNDKTRCFGLTIVCSCLAARYHSLRLLQSSFVFMSHFIQVTGRDTTIY